VGWWYQRHWRHQFNAAVKALLEPKDGSVHDPKTDHEASLSPKLISSTNDRNQIPRKRVSGAGVARNAGTCEEITAGPALSQGQNDLALSKTKQMFIDEPGDG
jgi:hypothetical protein